MSSDADTGDTSARKIPTLVQYCQRGMLFQFQISSSQLIRHLQWLQVMSTVCPIFVALKPVYNDFLLIEIESLGEDVRYDLVRPVLEHCSADTLLRLENSTPVCA